MLHTHIVIKLLVIALLVISPASHSEVISKADNGFVINIEVQVPVDTETAYLQFLKVSQWWHPDHTWFGKSENLTIDAKVGGCFCEIEGDKQALHMLVTYVEPNKEVRMTGGLGPLQMLGVHGGMAWKFTHIDADKTKISFQYQVTGYVEGGLDKLADIVNKVQALQINRLQEKLSL
ncbi:SRPBCC domain-containing protein [Litorilituus sediminis]|uniref:SRPBCC domain-containing protein n=1 Tax=Litorilituus sediminis TaxID=718192 RepID=A0A4P6PAK8_9GAMM|nr:SRPBCC domain-containing protein [Litorilituus sediminis]QBG37359.1 SRPBCC domain-containing protein [Litorilituus sediminis]